MTQKIETQTQIKHTVRRPGKLSWIYINVVGRRDTLYRYIQLARYRYRTNKNQKSKAFKPIVINEIGLSPPSLFDSYVNSMTSVTIDPKEEESLLLIVTKRGENGTTTGLN
jgi:hypothetical protein